MKCCSAQQWFKRLDRRIKCNCTLMLLGRARICGSAYFLRWRSQRGVLCLVRTKRSAVFAYDGCPYQKLDSCCADCT